jgi:hypothetical protein
MMMSPGFNVIEREQIEIMSCTGQISFEISESCSRVAKSHSFASTMIPFVKDVGKFSGHVAPLTAS